MNPPNSTTRYLRRIILAAVLAFCFVALAAQAETLALAHTYKAEGKNLDGSSYTGTVTLELISNTTFKITWKIGDTVTKGFGMRMNDAVSATYMIDGAPGLVIYKVLPDGRFDGIWAIKGQDGNGSETLTPVN